MADEIVDKATWLVELHDGSREWRERISGGYQVIKVEPPLAPIEHSHPTHGDINFTGTVSADGDVGLTGQRTVGGYKPTFKKGLLVGFEAA